MRIKFSTAIKLLMAFGMYFVGCGIGSIGKEDPVTILLGAGMGLVFVLFGGGCGILKFGWDDFKDYVLLKISTGILLGIVTIFGIIVAGG